MESFTIELISNAFPQLFPASTLNSLTNFHRSNWYWNVNGWLQFRKHLTHQCPKMLQRESWCFLTRNSQNCQNSFIWNPIFTLPSRILLKPWTLSFKKQTITPKIVSQFKCLEELRKLRFTLQRRDLVSHSLVRALVKILVALLARNLEWCWEKKDLIKQKRLTTLSTYILSWYTRTWLSTMSLATRRLQCCVVFLFFPSLTLETL